MNREEYRKLTDVEKRIKVAELCGWKNFEPNDNGTCDITEIGCGWLGTNLEGFELCPVPDYLNDLNAMAEAETMLVDGLGDLYNYHLWTVVRQDSERLGVWDQIFVWKATAAQRAEAFVLTMEPE